MKKIRETLKKLGLLLTHLFTINDNPHDISLGIALGVFLGILPGTGPVAALICAQLLRVNRAAALFGALITNTWFSLVVFGLSAKIGAQLLSVNLTEISGALQAAFHPFNIHKLLKLSFSQVILPVLAGFLIVSLTIAVVTYIASFLSLHAYRSLKKARGIPKSS